MTSRLRFPRFASTFSAILAAGVMAALAPAPARAVLPSPLDAGLWSFPGASPAPASAVSASLGLSDRWLGIQPHDNPAASPPRGVAVSGALLRMSRQDLRAENRSFSERGAFIDFAGASVSVPFGAYALAAYAHQPLLRLEDNAFSTGVAGGPVSPAVVLSNGSARELRVGLAVSRGHGRWRAGVAGEWQRRSDVYEREERSGSPDQGFRRVDFKGDGFGGQAGVTYGEDRPARGAFAAGAAVRYAPAISAEGEQRFELLSGDSLAVVSVERAAGLEGGVSASFRTAATFRVLAAAGSRAARDWDGFGVTSGTSFQWSVGGEFHDARDPWTLRFGGGQEFEDDVPERRAAQFGLGLGWQFEGARLDLGLLHRALRRDGRPTSYDDRLLATITTIF